MWNDILAMLKSPSRALRLEAWHEIHAGSIKEQLALSASQRRILADSFKAEDDEGVFQTALRVLMWLATVLPQGAAVSPALAPGMAESMSLGAELWKPFKKPSLVLRVSDPERMRRDEGALFMLGRPLPVTSYPHIMPHSVPLGAPDWGHVLARPYHAICLIGRLGLYGPEALARWSPTEPRFRFKTQQRKSRGRQGRLDKQYHCLEERLPDGTFHPHVAQDVDGKRTDYAVVQRHVADDGRAVVVNLAGCSSLGTLAAVTWAASDLFREPIISLPEGEKLTLDSRLEAFLKVTADITDYEWEPTPIELVKLYLDDYTWDKQKRKWCIEPPKHIKIVLAHGDPDQPLSALLDGKETRMEKGRELFRLLVRLGQRRHERGPVALALREFAQDAWIWGGEPATESTVRNRLKQLKHHYLRESLFIDTVGNKVQLLADAAVESTAAAMIPATLGVSAVEPTSERAGVPAGRVKKKPSTSSSAGRPKRPK